MREAIADLNREGYRVARCNRALALAVFLVIPFGWKLTELRRPIPNFLNASSHVRTGSNPLCSLIVQPCQVRTCLRCKIVGFFALHSCFGSGKAACPGKANRDIFSCFVQASFRLRSPGGFGVQNAFSLTSLSVRDRNRRSKRWLRSLSRRRKRCSESRPSVAQKVGHEAPNSLASCGEKKSAFLLWQRYEIFVLLCTSIQLSKNV